jgi:hypothetical protein
LSLLKKSNLVPQSPVFSTISCISFASLLHSSSSTWTSSIEGRSSGVPRMGCMKIESWDL